MKFHLYHFDSPGCFQKARNERTFLVIRLVGWLFHIFSSPYKRVSSMPRQFERRTLNAKHIIFQKYVFASYLSVNLIYCAVLRVRNLVGFHLQRLRDEILMEWYDIVIFPLKTFTSKEFLLKCEEKFQTILFIWIFLVVFINFCYSAVNISFNNTRY